MGRTTVHVIDTSAHLTQLPAHRAMEKRRRKSAPSEESNWWTTTDAQYTSFCLNLQTPQQKGRPNWRLAAQYKNDYCGSVSDTKCCGYSVENICKYLCLPPLGSLLSSPEFNTRHLSQRDEFVLDFKFFKCFT